MPTTLLDIMKRHLTRTKLSGSLGTNSHGERMGGIGYFVVITKPGITERLLGPFGSKREAQEEAYEHYLDQLPVGADAAESLFWVDAMGEPTSATAGEWKYQIAPKKV